MSVASRAVAAKSSIPAMEGILIEAGDQLRLTGYNLETGIQATVPAEIQEKGSLVLSARLFGEIVRKMPDDVVVFSSEGYMVNIKCGLSEFNILGTDPEEFPELPAVEQQNALTMPQPVLRSMIAQTLFAVSDNESRPVHTGSLFEVDEDRPDRGVGGRLPAGPAPGDGGRKKDGARSFSFVVPGSALSEVEKICAGEEDGHRHPGGPAHPVPGRGHRAGLPPAGGGVPGLSATPSPGTTPSMWRGTPGALLASIERVSLIISDKLKSPPALRLWGRDAVHHHQDRHRRRRRPVPHRRATARGWRSASTTSI